MLSYYLVRSSVSKTPVLISLNFATTPIPPFDFYFFLAFYLITSSALTSLICSNLAWNSLKISSSERSSPYMKGWSKISSIFIRLLGSYWSIPVTRF